MKLINLAIGITIILSSWLISYKIGVDSVKTEQREDFVTISNSLHTYRIPVDSMMYVERKSKDDRNYYNVRIESSYGSISFELFDTKIDGQTITAEEWKESLILSFRN